MLLWICQAGMLLSIQSPVFTHAVDTAADRMSKVQELHSQRHFCSVCVPMPADTVIEQYVATAQHHLTNPASCQKHMHEHYLWLADLCCI